MKGEIYDKKEIYDQLNKDVYFKDGGSMNLASLAGSIEKIRSKSKSSGGSGNLNSVSRYEVSSVNEMASLDLKEGDIVVIPEKREDITNGSSPTNTLKVDSPKNLIITKTAETSAGQYSGVRLVNADSMEAQLSMDPIDEYAVGDTVSAVIPAGYYYMSNDDGTQGAFSAVFVEPGAVYTYSNGEPLIYNANVCHRLETEYTRGEDEIDDHGNFVTVYLGNYQPDFNRFVANNEPIWQAGDVIDVPYKEVDVTDLMFHMNSDGGPESTPKSVRTTVYYTNQDYIEGIRYKRIADAPSDTNIKLSSLLIFRDQDSETLEPLHPYYYFGGEFVDSEADGIKFDFQVEFRELIGGLNSSQELNDDNGLISFRDGEIDTYLTALEVVWDDNNSRWVNKRQNDGYTSILDYYKFYYYANGKTYVASRSGNYARPVDISKDVIEDLREEVKSLKSDKMIDIGFEGFLNSYNRSDLDITLYKDEFASGFDHITGFDDLLDSCDVSVVDKLFFGKVRNIYGKISTGSNEPLEQLAFKILYTVSGGQISKATVLLAPSESAIQEGECLMFEYSGGSTVKVKRTHREA